MKDFSQEEFDKINKFVSETVAPALNMKNILSYNRYNEMSEKIRENEINNDKLFGRFANNNDEPYKDYKKEYPVVKCCQFCLYNDDMIAGYDEQKNRVAVDSISIDVCYDPSYKIKWRVIIRLAGEMYRKGQRHQYCYYWDNMVFLYGKKESIDSLEDVNEKLNHLKSLMPVKSDGRVKRFFKNKSWVGNREPGFFFKDHIRRIERRASLVAQPDSTDNYEEPVNVEETVAI